MKRFRTAAGILLGAIVSTLGVIPVSADTAALSLPPEAPAGVPAEVMLSADRMYGFAPMTVNLSGMLRSEEGELMPIHGGQQIRLVIESPFLQVSAGGSTTRMLNDVHYEASTPGPATPSAIRRSIEIRKPGTYAFRVQVIGADGAVLSSNEISVKAL